MESVCLHKKCTLQDERNELCTAIGGLIPSIAGAGVTILAGAPTAWSAHMRGVSVVLNTWRGPVRVVNRSVQSHFGMNASL